MIMIWMGLIVDQKSAEADQIQEELEVLSRIAPLITAHKEEMAHWSPHCVRVAKLTHQIAAEMGTSGKYLAFFTAAAFLHDWGKRDNGVSDLFYSDDKRIYTPEERFRAGQHGYLGARIAEQTLGFNLDDADVLWHIQAAALLHHHNFNRCIEAPAYEILFHGQPYEDKSRKAMPFVGRLVAVTDIFDGLTCERSYKRRWSKQEACLLLLHFAGVRYDPDIVNVLVGTVLGVKMRFQKLRVAFFPLTMKWRDLVFDLKPYIKKLLSPGRWQVA